MCFGDVQHPDQPCCCICVLRHDNFPPFPLCVCQPTRLEYLPDRSAPLLSLYRSYDGMYRLANGLWLRESPADRIVLPYAVVLVHCPPNMQAPAWLQDLIDRRLMVEVSVCVARVSV